VLRRRPLRVLASLSGVIAVTFVGYRLIPVNATTIGFAYLLVILVVASTWGFLEAALSSVLATLLFNFFFLPPIGTFTIADPQNWVALSAFLATSLIASRLSAKAKARASEAVERQMDLERLYTFSRAMLLTDKSAPFEKQVIERLAEIFHLDAVVLYERYTGAFSYVGVAGPEGLESELRDAARPGSLLCGRAVFLCNSRRQSWFGTGGEYGPVWFDHTRIGLAECGQPRGHWSGEGARGGACPEDGGCPTE
jgi:two-component system, OmpR family, sensor histidine kinase KdpD